MSTREIDKSGLKYIAFQGERQVIFWCGFIPDFWLNAWARSCGARGEGAFN